MLDLSDGVTLYHGSTVPVQFPDLSKCSPRKDIGQGFYLTSSAEQAEGFARIVARRAARERGEEGQPGGGFISSYRYCPARRARDNSWLAFLMQSHF